MDREELLKRLEAAGEKHRKNAEAKAESKKKPSPPVVVEEVEAEEKVVKEEEVKDEKKYLYIGGKRVVEAKCRSRGKNSWVMEDGTDVNMDTGRRMYGKWELVWLRLTSWKWWLCGQTLGKVLIGYGVVLFVVGSWWTRFMDGQHAWDGGKETAFYTMERFAAASGMVIGLWLALAFVMINAGAGWGPPGEYGSDQDLEEDEEEEGQR